MTIKATFWCRSGLDPEWPGVTFPGGHVEQGEPFAKAVIREVWEETGLTIQAPKLCGFKQFFDDDGTRVIVLLYKNLYSQPQYAVWAGLFPPYFVKFSCHTHKYACENLPRLAKKSLAHPPFSAVNTGSKTGSFSGELRSSAEGRVFWIKRSELGQYQLPVGFDQMIRVFEDDGVSEQYVHLANDEVVRELW